MIQTIVVFAVGASALSATRQPGDFQDVMSKLDDRCHTADAGALDCTKYCPDAGLNLCRFSDPTLAAVAVAVDPKDAQQERLAVVEALNKGSTKAFSTSVLPPLQGFTAESVTEVATRLVQALALVIADRAQRESAAFVLEELYGGLCATELKGWFRSTCALADPGDGGFELSSYGTGAPAIQLLRTALEADVKAFPSVAGRVVTLALIEEDQRQYAVDKAYTSEGDGYNGNGFHWDAGMPDSVGTSVEQAVTDLSQGVWAFDALRPVTVQVAVANETASIDHRLLAPRTQWVACALSLPSGIQSSAAAYGPDGGADLERPQQVRAQILTAFVISPACEGLFKRTTRLEELLVLDDAATSLVIPVDAALAQLKTEKERYDAALKPRRVSGDGGTETDADRRQQVIDVMAASLRVSRAGLKLGELGLQAVPRVCSAAVSPYETTCKSAESLGAAARLPRLVDRQLELASAVIEQDWNAVAVGSTRLAVDYCKTDKKCWEAVPKVTGQVNGALAILSAKSADDAAKVIDSLADPIGEWRGKTEAGRFTVSLTSHAGVSGGVEWRWGQYGVVAEKGGAYTAAPTLSFPIGAELAWGQRTFAVSLLVSVLDPFAFLQYDAAKDGRLPGARLLSVLAPGAHLRFSLGRSPFGLGLFAVYRPGFRSFESGVNAPGANVMQVGLEATIDVTLFTLLRRSK